MINSSKIDELISVMARLRDPQTGCPWDLQQDVHSLCPHTLEEAHELVDAVERGTPGEICAELGDLLFQVVFYARLGEEQGQFDFAAVVDGIIDKLVRRHPHVFGDVQVADASAQSEAWEAHKAEERRRHGNGDGALSGVALALPALSRAAKLQRRAARLGFDWEAIRPVFDKVMEELEEVREEVDQDAVPDRVEDEIGDLLFACTNLARHAGIDPESALHRANRKFERRFIAMETLAGEQGRGLASLDADAWEDLWNAAKQRDAQAQGKS